MCGRGILKGNGVGELESGEATSQFRMLGEDIIKWCRHWVVYKEEGGSWND